MPAVSKSQQRAAGMALAAKRGDMKVSELQGAAKEMYDSMTEKELEKFAKTKTKNLPDKKESVNEAKLKDDNASLEKVVQFLKAIGLRNADKKNAKKFVQQYGLLSSLLNSLKEEKNTINYKALAETLLDEEIDTLINEAGDVKEATERLKRAVQSGNRLSVTELDNDELSIATGHRYGVKVKVLGYNK